jgi:hypothetical protein
MHQLHTKTNILMFNHLLSSMSCLLQLQMLKHESPSLIDAQSTASRRKTNVYH